MSEMDYANEGLLLRYEIHDRSGYDPCVRLLILKRGNAAFYRTGETRRDEDGPDRFLTLSDGAVSEVRRILSDARLYGLGAIEKPAGNREGCSTYDFWFSAGGHQIAYRACGLENTAGEEACPKANALVAALEKLGKVLIPEGVPAACFRPGRRTPPAPVPAAAPVMAGTFTVYDFRKAKEDRMLGDPRRKERLERYAFERRADGSCAFTFQVGWPGGAGHWDGAGNTFPLPEEWFRGSYRMFLYKLTARYPAKKYGFSREELAAVPGLKEFLGFTDGSYAPLKPDRRTGEKGPPPEARDDRELASAAGFRAVIHKEALERVNRIRPGIRSVIDPYPPEAYLQEYWDYPGKWYTIVAVPKEADSREALIDAIVRATLAGFPKG